MKNVLRVDEECPQGLGGFEGERPLTDSQQLVDETLFYVRRILPGDFSGLQFSPHLTGP